MGKRKRAKDAGTYKCCICQDPVSEVSAPDHISHISELAGANNIARTSCGHLMHLSCLMTYMFGKVPSSYRYRDFLDIPCPVCKENFLIQSSDEDKAESENEDGDVRRLLN